METPLEEKIRRRSDKASWQGVGRGALTLTSDRILFERKKSFFSSELVLERSVRYSQLLDVKVGEGASIELKWNLVNGSEAVESVILEDVSQAIEAASIIGESLSELKKRKEEEEAQERRNRIRQAQYASYIWNTVTRLLSLVNFSYQMLADLRYEDWDSVEAKAKRLEGELKALKDEAGFQDKGLQEKLEKAIKQRNTVSVHSVMYDSITNVTSQVRLDQPPKSEWKGFKGEGPPYWRDVPYLLLLTLELSEALLGQELRDQSEVESVLKRAFKAALIVREKFGVDVLPSLEEASPMLREGDEGAIDILKAQKLIEEYVKNRLYEAITEAE